MKIAIAKDGRNVSGHFGHCEGFELFHIDTGKIIKRVFLENPGHKPGFLPKFLSDNGTNVIISGGMGSSAQQLFQTCGIEVVVGVQGDLETAIEQFMHGKLSSTHSVCNEHAHKGSCGES